MYKYTAKKMSAAALRVGSLGKKGRVMRANMIMAQSMGLTGIANKNRGRLVKRGGITIGAGAGVIAAASNRRSSGGNGLAPRSSGGTMGVY